MRKFYRDDWEVSGPMRPFAIVIGVSCAVGCIVLLVLRLFPQLVILVPFTIICLTAGFKGISPDDRKRAREEGRYQPPRRHTW